MMTVVICSVSVERLHEIKCNIAQTIGVEHEIISINNKEEKWPIAKAYNYGAQQAKYPFLFFVHEDVKFHSQGWGTFIEEKLKEPDCGAIGFAGSRVRLNCYSGWGNADKYNILYLYQGIGAGLTKFCVENVYANNPFAEVVTLDGLGLFVRKNLWEQYPFDESLLTGFHCYDIDFTLQLFVARFKNYVCCSSDCLIEHFSLGSYTEEWFAMTARLHSKWKHLLPLKTSDVELSDKMRRKYEEACSYDFLRRMLKKDCSSEDKLTVLRDYWLRPFSWKHFRRSVFCSFAFFTNIKSK